MNASDPHRRGVLAGGGLAALAGATPARVDPRPSSDEVMGYLMDVTGISRQAKADGMGDYGRMAGSRYDAMTSAYIEAAFRRFRLSEVRQEQFPIPQANWVLQAAALRLAGAELAIDFPSAFTSHESRTTGAGGREATVVDIGRGSPGEIAGRDLTGKIVLVHGYAEGIVFGHGAQVVVSRLAAEGKILGVIVAVHQPGDPQTRYSVIASSPGIRGGAGLEKLYWTNISGPDGDRLAGLIRAAGGEARVRITVAGAMKAGWTTQNTMGVVPGRSAETVLFLAHTDCHFQGATDNASGVSVLLALARYFGRRQTPLARTICLVGTGSHHNGPSGGVRNLIARHPDLIKRTVMVVNLEHVGSRDPNGKGGLKPGGGATNLFVPAQNPAIISAMRAAAAANSIAIGAEVRSFWSADYAPFLTIGTPALMLMQPTFWYHTEADTPDKISPDDLARVARTYVDFVEATDAVPAAVLAKGTPTRDLLSDLLARRRQQP